MIAAKYSTADIGLKNYFKMIFTAAKQRNVSRFARWNLESFLYARLAFGYKDDDWASEQDRMLSKDYISDKSLEKPSEFILKLCGIPTIIKYRMLLSGSYDRLLKKML